MPPSARLGYQPQLSLTFLKLHLRLVLSPLNVYYRGKAQSTLFFFWSYLNGNSNNIRNQSPVALVDLVVTVVLLRQMTRRKFDFYLFLPVVFLLIFGTVTIASVSPENLPSHLLYLAISLAFFLFFSFFDLDFLLPLSPIIYLLSLGFLCLPFVLGTVTRGSVRWIPIGGLTIQPSELIKPFLAATAAWFWAEGEFSWRKLIIFSALSLPILLLIFFQPDLGSTLVVLCLLAATFLVSGVSGKQALTLFLITMVLVPLSFFSLKSYQKMRLVHFLNPYADPLGEGYNVIQAKIAVGSGGIFGKGFGRGTQSHLAFLPERHTDFIFASLSEEGGFAGAGLILLFYFFLFLRLLKIGGGAKEKSFSVLVVGLFFSLFFQTTVNLGMNIGLLPITGITLPLVSYGGSSLLSTMISLGLVEAVSRQQSQAKVIEIR